MIHILEDKGVYSDFKDGKLTFSTYVTDSGGDEDQRVLLDIANRLFDPNVANYPDEIGLECKFTLSSILDLMIDGRRYTAHKREEVIGEEDKPMFDAMREELEGMIARIKALRVENK